MPDCFESAETLGNAATRVLFLPTTFEADAGRHEYGGH